MEKLIPIRVPWMIAPSTPFLTLMAEEEAETAKIKFAAFFKLEEIKLGKEKDSNFIEVIDKMQIDETDKSGIYQLMQGYFEGVGWIRKNPQHSNREVLNEKNYDWSEVVSHNIPLNSTWKEKTNDYWKNKKISPDPSVYIVENSNWIKETNADRWNCKHFLIVGEKSYIEILAQKVTWESKGRILGW